MATMRDSWVIRIGSASVRRADSDVTAPRIERDLSPHVGAMRTIASIGHVMRTATMS